MTEEEKKEEKYHFYTYKNFLPPREVQMAYREADIFDDFVIYYLYELLETHFKEEGWHRAMIKTVIALLLNYFANQVPEGDDPLKRLEGE